MTQQQQDSAAAFQRVADALRAVADGDDAAALTILNAATHGEAVHAAVVLLFALRESLLERFGPARLELALRKSADNLTEDAVLTQVELIVNDETKRDGQHG